MTQETLHPTLQPDMTERLPTSYEETPTTDQYVNEVLKRHEAYDNDGIMRPIYHIDGRRVVFRTRQEMPLYENAGVTVPGGELIPPIESKDLEEIAPYYVEPLHSTKEVANYAREHQNDNAEKDNIVVVTNTPEGLLAAGALLSTDESLSNRLNFLAEDAASGDYKDPQTLAVVDALLASITITEEGSVGRLTNTEGWAVALTALTGDKTAQAIVDRKLSALLIDERSRSSERITHGHERIEAADNERLRQNEIQRQFRMPEQETPEPIPLEQLALVHSTSYDIKRNTDGTVVLRSAGDLHEAKVPRASLHFTLNSRVYPHAQAQGSWGVSDRLIVANLKETVDASHRLPQKLDGVDTWFTLNPGEELALPGALIVEPAETLKDGAVIESTEHGVNFLAKENYSTEEVANINILKTKYGIVSLTKSTAEDVKEIALCQAMERVGVPLELMDGPSQNGHGMSSEKLAQRIHRTGNQLGIPGGKHFETPEANMEKAAFLDLPRLSGRLRYQSSIYEMELQAYPDAAIEARRRALASGFYACRPLSLSDAALEKQRRDEAERPIF